SVFPELIQSDRPGISSRSARKRWVRPERSLSIFAVPTIRGVVGILPARRSVTALTSSSASPQKKRANRESQTPPYTQGSLAGGGGSGANVRRPEPIPSAGRPVYHE